VGRNLHNYYANPTNIRLTDFSKEAERIFIRCHILLVFQIACIGMAFSFFRSVEIAVKFVTKASITGFLFFS